MTTATENDVTNPTVEGGEEAEADQLFAEAAAAREGTPAEKPADPDQGAAATTQDGGEAEALRTGEGEPGNDQEGQPGGSEGEAAAAAEPGESDIWANVSPEAKAAFEAADQRARDYEQKFKSREGRERALQRQVDELKRSGGTEQEQPRKPLKELLADDTVKQLGEDYPDLKPVLETLVAAAERIDGVEQQVGEAKTTAATAVTAPEVKALSAAVPNWTELAADERFEAWVEDQPKKVRDAFHDNFDAITDAKSAADLVFKPFAEFIAPQRQEETGEGGQPKPSKRERQAAGAKGTTVTAPTTAGGDSDDPNVQFAQAAAKKDRERGLRA